MRVCIGPVCDCLGAKDLLAREQEQANGVPVLGVECLGHCDLAPVAAARRRPSSPRSPTGRTTAPPPGLAQADETLADYEARGGLVGPRATCRPTRRIVEELKASGLTGYGGAGFPTGVKWEAVAREPAPALRRRQRRRGRARDDQGPLRDGAAAAPHARGDADRHALRRGDRGLHLPARGVRDRARAAPDPGARGAARGRPPRRASRSSSSSARAPTSAARRRPCSSRWRAGAGCRG